MLYCACGAPWSFFVAQSTSGEDAWAEFWFITISSVFLSASAAKALSECLGKTHLGCERIGTEPIQVQLLGLPEHFKRHRAHRHFGHLPCTAIDWTQSDELAFCCGHQIRFLNLLINQPNLSIDKKQSHHKTITSLSERSKNEEHDRRRHLPGSESSIQTLRRSMWLHEDIHRDDKTHANKSRQCCGSKCIVNSTRLMMLTWWRDWLSPWDHVHCKIQDLDELTWLVIVMVSRA